MCKQGANKEKVELFKELGLFEAKEMWVTVKQAAKWYMVNERTIRKWIENGIVKFTEMMTGGYTRYYLVKINLNERWVDRKQGMKNKKLMNNYTSTNPYTFTF